MQSTTISAPGQSIWIPGKGSMPFHVAQVSKAIEEYDPRLSLGKDQNSGDWVVLRENGPDGIPYFPVFGLGAELPSADDVKKELSARDVSHNGAKIVEAVVRRQDARRAAAMSQADDGAHEAAKALEWAHRKLGGSGDGVKVIMPRGIDA